MATPARIPSESRFPLLDLVHPHEQIRGVAVALAIGLVLGGCGMLWGGMPLWGATTIVLGVLLVPGVRKWRADLARFGVVGMVLSILLFTQGFHTVEHMVQWVQYHVLNWLPRESTGLLSAANAEWVHFVWNWTVLLVVIYLVRGGMRSPWAWLLLAWSLAHSLEHTYMFVRHLEVLSELRRMGVSGITAQGLPGILGRDGWLATSTVTQGTFLCRLPGLATAHRLDVHFWWNIGETTLMLLAGHRYLRSRA
jgi:hypothetical protein